MEKRRTVEDRIRQTSKASGEAFWIGIQRVIDDLKERFKEEEQETHKKSQEENENNSEDKILKNLNRKFIIQVDQSEASQVGT